MKNRLHIVAFKHVFDASVVPLQNALETTWPFTDASRLRDFPPRLAADNKHSVCCCSSRPCRA